MAKDVAESLKEHFSCVVDARDIAAAADLLRQTFQGERCRGSVRYKSSSGETRHGNMITAPVFEGGAIVGALGIMRDDSLPRPVLLWLAELERGNPLRLSRRVEGKEWADLQLRSVAL